MPNFSDWSKNPESNIEELSRKKPEAADRWDTLPEESSDPGGEIVAHALAPAPEEVAVAAYFKAEKRGFTPGHDVEDWLEAEAELSQAEDE